MFFRESGFSLVEIMLAIVLLGIIATFLLPVLNFGYAEIFTAGDKSRAVYEAQTKLNTEILISTTGSSITLSGIAFEGETIPDLNVIRLQGESEDYRGITVDKSVKLSYYILDD